jgi:hypothetical protein
MAPKPRACHMAPMIGIDLGHVTPWICLGLGHVGPRLNRLIHVAPNLDHLGHVAHMPTRPHRPCGNYVRAPRPCDT